MKHVITASFLVLAAVLYSAGSASGAMALVGAGIVAEGIFWMRLFRGR